MNLKNRKNGGWINTVLTMPWVSSELFITLSLLVVETNTLQELINI